MSHHFSGSTFEAIERLPRLRGAGSFSAQVPAPHWPWQCLLWKGQETKSLHERPGLGDYPACDTLPCSPQTGARFPEVCGVCSLQGSLVPFNAQGPCGQHKSTCPLQGCLGIPQDSTVYRAAPPDTPPPTGGRGPKPVTPSLSVSGLITIVIISGELSLFSQRK